VTQICLVQNSAADRHSLLRGLTMRYENKSMPLLHWPLFLRRLAGSALVGLCLIAVSLAFGMWGYHSLEQLGWIDAYENAAMILSGMGPLHTPQTVAGKIFAGSYALYSGIAVLAFAGIIFAPIVHRFLHAMHLEGAEPDDRES
jgi:hypothetical protein